MVQTNFFYKRPNIYAYIFITAVGRMREGMGQILPWFELSEKIDYFNLHILSL